jgi:hypothetical protein
MPDHPDWTDPILATFSQQILAVNNQAVTVVETGTLQSIIPAVATRRIVLVAWTLAASAGNDARTALRDWVQLRAIDSVTGLILARVAISPASPLADAHVVPGASQTAIGNGVSIIGSSRAGSGAQLVTVDMAYYLAS